MVKWYHTGFWYRGLRFESLWASQGPFSVAVNTSACHAEDHGFDSRKDRQLVMWRNGYAEDCKSFYPGSIPGITSRL